MSTFWEDLKKSLKTWGTTAAGKAEELGKVAATKTEEITKIGKIKLEIHQLERDREKNFSKLGKYVYESVENENVMNFAGNDQFFSFIQKAKDIQDQIKRKEELIKKVKLEYGESKDISDEAEVGEKKEEKTQKTADE